MIPLLLLSLAIASTAGKTPKVLLIGIDGLRADAALAANAPAIHGLMERGAWTAEASAGSVTVSGPGWSNVLTSTWADKHGVRDNEFAGARFAEYPPFFSLAKRARPQLVTAWFASWPPLDRFLAHDCPLDFQGCWDMVKEDGDNRVAAAAIETLAHHDPDLLFCYFGDVDETGHDQGFSRWVPEYVRAIETVDDQVGRVLAAMDARPQREAEDWLVLLVTDHGGSLDRNHGRDEPAHRDVLLVMSGESVPRARLTRSANQVDVGPTALAHLGIAIDPAWQLDGRVLLPAPPIALGENLVFNGDAEKSTGAADAHENAGVAGFRDRGAFTVVRYGAQGGYPLPTVPGPPDRGENFFCGGDAQRSEIEQEIDVGARAGEIDRGALSFELSAWLGGYSDQRDLAGVDVAFLGGEGGDDGGTLARASLAPVTLEDRKAAFGGDKAALTGFLRREAKGAVPKGTRRIVVTPWSEAASGSADGYIDDIRLVLR